MRMIFRPVLLGGVLALAACEQEPSDKLADRVEDAGETRAETIEAGADALRDRAEAFDEAADAVRENADARADGIEAADMPVERLSEETRDAIAADEAPAVR